MTVSDTNLVASRYIKRELKNLTQKRSVFTFFYLIPFQITFSVEQF